VIRATLLGGGDADAREHAIAAALEPHAQNAVILEGLPAQHNALAGHARLDVVRIAAGCPCCQGNTVLRVHLNRLLRQRPDRLFIGVMAADHVPALRAFLSSPPYDGMLELTQDLLPGSRSR